MAVDRTRTLRGALAGAAAAAVWAAQQPLDQRVFGCAYDDVELLGRFVTDGRAAYPIGLAHAPRQRRACSAPLYANAAPRAAGAAPCCAGRSAGLAEHLATWPGTAALTRACTPPRDELPQLWGSGRAFAQATWRHLLFGTVLGELERRLNPPDSEPQPIDPAAAASNGHGSAEYVVSPQHLTRRLRVLITGATGFAGPPSRRGLRGRGRRRHRRAAVVGGRPARPRRRASARRGRAAGRRLPPRRARARRASRGRTRSARSPTTWR